jgi:hypothetical protein
MSRMRPVKSRHVFEIVWFVKKPPETVRGKIADNYFALKNIFHLTMG